MPKALIVVILLALVAPGVAFAAPTCIGGSCSDASTNSEGYGGGSCQSPSGETLRRETVTVLVSSMGLTTATLVFDHRCHGVDMGGTKRTEADVVLRFEVSAVGVRVSASDTWSEREQTRPTMWRDCSHNARVEAGASGVTVPIGCTSSVQLFGTELVPALGPTDIPSLP